MGTRHWPEDAEDYVDELEQQLAKANKRIALLERVEEIFNESPELTFDDVKGMFSDELNKFAIEQQIEALESLNINPKNESEDRVVAIIEQRIEQLHKEQE